MRKTNRVGQIYVTTPCPHGLSLWTASACPAYNTQDLVESPRTSFAAKPDSCLVIQVSYDDLDVPHKIDLARTAHQSHFCHLPILAYQVQDAQCNVLTGRCSLNIVPTQNTLQFGAQSKSWKCLSLSITAVTQGVDLTGSSMLCCRQLLEAPWAGRSAPSQACWP